MAIDFEKILNQIVSDVVALAGENFNKYAAETKSDVQKFLNEVKDDLARWTKQYVAGELSRDDFEFLLLGQKELIELHALKRAGLTLIQIDELKNGILNSIVNTVSAAI